MFFQRKKAIEDILSITLQAAIKAAAKIG